MIERHYRAAPSEALRSESLGLLVALYDRRSTQTHVLASPLPEMLRALADDICGVAEIAERLAQQFDLGDGSNAEVLLTERLNELVALGLVESL